MKYIVKIVLVTTVAQSQQEYFLCTKNKQTKITTFYLYTF